MPRVVVTVEVLTSVPPDVEFVVFEYHLTVRLVPLLVPVPVLQML